MIYTCTTNPSLDYYVSLNKLNKGVNNRSEIEMYDAGGKGVNVSIVLNNLCISTICLGFLGGFTKEFYLKFISDYPYIQPLFTSISDNTRINVKIMESVKETGINASGPHITKEEFAKFKSRLNSVYSDDYFVLSGNIQDDIQENMIEAIKQLSEDGVKIVLDTNKTIIDSCLDSNLFMVKLNNEYFMNTDKTVDEVGKELLNKQISYVMYSAPNKDAILYYKGGKLLCHNYSDSLLNVTGSADSMVAGFLYGIIRGGDEMEAFRYAGAAGLATSMSNDLSSKEKIEEVYSQIEVSIL